MGHQARLEAFYEYLEGLKKGLVGQPKGKMSDKIKTRNKFKKRRYEKNI